MTIRRLTLAVVAFLALSASVARAQFADQATWAGSGAGSANAQTITLSNASSYADLLGVVVKFAPGATNTAAATLNVNGFGSSPEVRKPNGAGLTSLTGGEVVSGQPAEVMYNGTYFVLLAPVTLPVGAASIQSSAYGFSAPPNMSISATVGSNQLTVALKTAANVDASASSPIPIAFRDVTIANGNPTFVSVSGILSFTIASGNTMGCQSGIMCRLWVFAINNGGSVGLCAYNANSANSISGINEQALQTSASGTSGGNAAWTLYCSQSGVTSKAVRYLGYVEVQEVTAGVWATGPTYTQLFGPGIKKPGEVIQTTYFQTTASAAGAGGITVAATPVTLSVSPTSAANVVRVTAYASMSVVTGASGGQSVFAQIGRNSSVNLFGTLAVNTPKDFTGVAKPVTVPMIGMDQPNTTSATAYTVYMWSFTGGTSAINEATSGGAAVSSIVADEIQG